MEQYETLTLEIVLDISYERTENGGLDCLRILDPNAPGYIWTRPVALAADLSLWLEQQVEAELLRRFENEALEQK